MVNTNFLKQ